MKFDVEHVIYNKVYTPAEWLVCRVEDACTDGCLVALSEESRHIGLDHHLLRGHGLAIGQGIVHQTVVSQSKEAPGSDAFWQSEADVDVALVVGLQSRIEECSLLEILTQLRCRVG